MIVNKESCEDYTIILSTYDICQIKKLTKSYVDKLDLDATYSGSMLKFLVQLMGLTYEYENIEIPITKNGYDLLITILNH